MIHKTLRIKLKIEQNEPHKKSRIGRQAIPAPLVAPVMLL